MTNPEPPTTLHRPEYIGLVGGAQYKLEEGEENVTEYAIVIVGDGRGDLYEASEADLKILGRQILSVVGEL